MKKYVVLMNTKHFSFHMNTNSLKIAGYLMNLKVCKYARIMDTESLRSLDFVKRQ